VNIDIKTLVREYIAKEIMQEIRLENSPMVVRVLGEVLANKPGMLEEVHCEALAVARELLKGIEQ
jgi:hypothetical protein